MYRPCAPKEELNKDRYIIHWAFTVQGHPTNTKQRKNHKAKAKQTHTNKTTQNKTQSKNGTPVISWSVYSHLKRIRRDDNIVSPLGLVWQNKIRANNEQRKCHTAICEVGSNMSTMRKPRLPPARSLEITECEPRGQHFSQITSTQSKSQQWHCHVAKGKLEIKHSETQWNVVWNRI